MATLDETNIFETPVTAQEPKRFSPEYFAQRKEQKAEQKEQYKALGQSVRDNLALGNIEQAYESFTQLPVIDQMVLYMTPAVGNVIDAYEAKYFAEKSGRQLKDPEAYQLELLMGGDPREVRPFTQKDPVSGAFSTLAGLSSLFGAGEIPSALKAVTLPLARRFGMVSRTGTEGGGGGITQLVPESSTDIAGYKSNLEGLALKGQNMEDQKTGMDLLNYLKSPKRTNEGISPKEQEFVQFEKIFEVTGKTPETLTKQDVVDYVTQARPRLYRIERKESGPTYIRDDEFDIDYEEDDYFYTQAQAFRQEDLLEGVRDDFDYLHGNMKQAFDVDSVYDVKLNKQNFTKSRFNTFLEYGEDPAFKQVYKKNIGRRIPLEEPPVFNVYEGNALVDTIDMKDYVGDVTLKDIISREVIDKNRTVVPASIDEQMTFTSDVFDDFYETVADIRLADMVDSDEITRSYNVIPMEGNRPLAGTYSDLTIRGDANDGYAVYRNDDLISDDALSFDEAQIQAREELINQGYGGGTPANDELSYTDIEDPAKNLFDEDVYTGQASLPTNFGNYSGYRLPMGGATNYREFTIHLDNPNTPTRFTSNKGDKHFAGGDEFLHYRVSDRTDTDGKKVLFVEEIQSDLHDSAKSQRVKNTYELSDKKVAEINEELEKLGFSNASLKGKANFDEPSTLSITLNGQTELIRPSGVALLASTLKRLGDQTNLSAINGLSPNQAKALYEQFGQDKIIKMAEVLKPYTDSGTIPDFPYKGNDWVELAVKDIMKLAAEGDYDRVAFTNAPTQIRRNNKKLNFINEVGVQKIPSVDEYIKSDQYKVDLERNKRIRYDDALSAEGASVSQPYIEENFKKRFPTIDVYFEKNPVALEDVKEATINTWSRNNPEGQFKLTTKGVQLNEDDVFLSPQQILDEVKAGKYEFGSGSYSTAEFDDSLQMLPKKLQERIKKDIELGNIPTSIDDGQIYVVNEKLGSGKKYLDIYGQKIPQQLKKVGQKLDKSADVKLNDILYEPYQTDLGPDGLYNAYDLIQSADPKDVENLDIVPLQHKAASIDITPQMKEKLLQGINVMYKGGIVNKYKSMDKPIMGNTREM